MRTQNLQKVCCQAEAAAAPGAPRVVAAAAAGNLLEWYDWSVYGFLVVYIGINFFPSSSATASLLWTFATFGAGFLMRPVGAIVIGWVAERHGRKTALMTTFYVMAAGTVPIACIPNYDAIGVYAPMLLVACRLLQGFSAGGELGGALAFLAEWAPPRRRAFYTSFQQASTQGGVLLGSGVATLLNAALTPADMAAWGWRLPFLLGGLLLPVAFWLRRRIDETPVYLAARQRRAPPPAPREAARLTLRAIGLIVAPVASQYLFFTYMATFVALYGGLPQEQALLSNTIALGVMVVCIPAMGALSDRVGRRPLLIAASAIGLAGAAAVFSYIATAPGLLAIVALQACLAVVVAMFHGAGPAAVTELFSSCGRALLVSLAYGLGVALAGGGAPFLAVWLMHWSGSPAAPGWYIAAACAITGAVALRMRETAGCRLD